MTEQSKSKFKNSLIFPAIMLGAFTLVASAMLSMGDGGTREAIEMRLAEDLKASIDQVISDKLHDNDLLASAFEMTGPSGAPTTFYQGTMDGKVTAVAYTVSSFGYSGEILTIMAVAPTGKILGVRVLSHTETPGLGDKIEVAKDDWVLGFEGRALGDPVASQWFVKKDGGQFDEFSGATITPRAVVKAVKSGLDFFEANKDRLLNVATNSEG